jgi:hypothetical protein
LKYCIPVFARACHLTGALPFPAENGCSKSVLLKNTKTEKCHVKPARGDASYQGRKEAFIGIARSSNGQTG